MRTFIRRKGLEDQIEVDSAGILNYHQGELPDSRMRMHASRRGYNLTHRSRPVCTADFWDFDLIIGMDDRNIQDLKEHDPSSPEYYGHPYQVSYQIQESPPYKRDANGESNHIPYAWHASAYGYLAIPLYGSSRYQPNQVQSYLVTRRV